MNHIAQWTVQLFVFEHDDSVSVRAELATPRGPVQGHGRADLTGVQRYLPEAADVLAASRALSDLAEQLQPLATTDDDNGREHARLERRRRADVVLAAAGPPR